MKKSFLFLLTLFALFSCSSDDNNGGNENPSIQVEQIAATIDKASKYVDEYLAFVSSQNDLSQEDIDAISESMELIESSVGQSMNKIIIKYPSIDVDGKLIMVSGCIFYNSEATSFNEIVLFTHQTAFGDESVPSGGVMSMLEPSVLTKNKNAIVFASDYIGFNATRDKVHPYMNQELCARNEIDMLKAGMVFLMQNPSLPQLVTPAQGLKTYIVGYSQGGSVALATHRALEAEPQLAADINFKGSYCGAGPFNLETTFELFKEQSELTLPAVLPYVLMGMYESYKSEFNGIDRNDYLSEQAIKCDVFSFLNSKSNMQNIFSLFKKNNLTSVNTIMSEEARNENSVLWQTLVKCMRKQNLIDGSWSPKHKVLLYHSKNDDIVSYQNSVQAHNLWKDNNNCELKTAIARVGHIAGYATFIVTLSNGAYRVDQ